MPTVGYMRVEYHTFVLGQLSRLAFVCETPYNPRLNDKGKPGENRGRKAMGLTPCGAKTARLPNSTTKNGVEFSEPVG